MFRAASRTDYAFGTRGSIPRTVPGGSGASTTNRGKNPDNEPFPVETAAPLRARGQRSLQTPSGPVVVVQQPPGALQSMSGHTAVQPAAFHCFCRA